MPAQVICVRCKTEMGAGEAPARLSLCTACDVLMETMRTPTVRLCYYAELIRSYTDRIGRGSYTDVPSPARDARVAAGMVAMVHDKLAAP